MNGALLFLFCDHTDSVCVGFAKYVRESALSATNWRGDRMWCKCGIVCCEKTPRQAVAPRPCKAPARNGMKSQSSATLRDEPTPSMGRYGREIINGWWEVALHLEAKAFQLFTNTIWVALMILFHAILSRV